MTSINTERERLILLEERLSSASKELRSLEKDLNEAEMENRTLRYEARQFAAFKDQQDKGLSSYLLDIIKICISVILALLGVKYGLNK